MIVAEIAILRNNIRNELPITEWLLELIGRKFCAKPSNSRTARDGLFVE